MVSRRLKRPEEDANRESQKKVIFGFCGGMMGEFRREIMM